eukprot:gene33179-40939_t
MGTVYALLYGGEGPYSSVDCTPIIQPDFVDCERPIVLVRLDDTDGKVPYTVSGTVPRLVPFVPVRSPLSNATSLHSLWLLAPLQDAHFTDSPEHRTLIDQEYMRLSRLHREDCFERHDVFQKRKRREAVKP